jgi:NADPH-dependent 2,4-dienoyl-CoA reductase/sulfur reductase-like enzyme
MELSAMIEKEVIDGGAKIVPLSGNCVAESSGDKIESLRCDCGRIAGDIFIFSAGVKPNNKLALEAGLSIGKSGGILVSNKMTTSNFNIYACGDCAEFKNLITRRGELGRVAPIAVRSGYVAGMNVAGKFKTIDGILNPSLMKVFEKYCGKTGLGYCEAREYLGDRFGIEKIESSELPGYMFMENGSIYLEVYYDKYSLKIVGGAIFGKRLMKELDILTLAITQNITVDKLSDMDYLYTPDYCGATDPLFSLGRKIQK